MNRDKVQEALGYLTMGNVERAREALIDALAQPPALDVERLARALTSHRGDRHTDGEDYEAAAAIAAEYAKDPQP